MTKTVLITTSGSPAVAGLSMALKGALGSLPVVSPPASALERFQPEVLHVLSTDDLAEGDVDRANSAGARIVVDAHDLHRFCLRGQLLKCNRTFCSDAARYGEAKCFAYDFDIKRGSAPDAVFKEFVPADKPARSALLPTCELDTRGKFAKAHPAAIADDITSRRRNLVRLISKIDFILCANEAITQGLKDFGLSEKNFYTDDSLFDLTKPADAQMLAKRADMIARAGKHALDLPRPAKWRAERENSLLMMQDLFQKRLVWESRPSHIELATNNICNLRCLMCSPESRPTKRSLSEAETESICDQIFPTASLVTPSAGSEPLLGDFELITRLCDKYEVELNVITNGTLLTPDRYELMRRRLGRLQISFDACDGETYEKIRVGAKFDKVVENIRRVAKLTAADNVELMASSVVMRLNYKKMAEYVEFVAGLGVNSVALQQLLINFEALKDWQISGVVPDEEIQAEIDRAIEAAKRCKINLHVGISTPRVYKYGRQDFKLFKLDYLPELVIQRYPKMCYQSAMYLKVEPDGSVFPCCRAPAELNMGNLKERPFEEIWNGKKYQQLRKEMFTGKYRRCCRGCPLLTLYSEGSLVIQ
jgi:radical SAM protein with 4Fe4S-binding SPASM domain